MQLRDMTFSPTLNPHPPQPLLQSLLQPFKASARGSANVMEISATASRYTHRPVTRSLPFLWVGECGEVEGVCVFARACVCVGGGGGGWGELNITQAQLNASVGHGSLCTASYQPQYTRQQKLSNF